MGKENISNFKEFTLKSEVDEALKIKILKSLKYMFSGYGRLPKEIKDKIVFNKIPIDVYQKVSDYYNVEKTLPSDTYIEFSKLKLKHIGKGIHDHFLATLGFIELIGLEKLTKYNTIDLYNSMLDEIRSLPDIKNSDNVIKDYNTFREIMARKDSPSKDLGLIITTRFQDEYKYYSSLF